MKDYYKPPRHTRFPLGTVYAEADVLRNLANGDFETALSRHANGDWGDVSPAHREANERALVAGMILFSVYRHRDGTPLWIVTDGDRSKTRVLLPPITNSLTQPQWH